jgi:hypothetical protein
LVQDWVVTPYSFTLNRLKHPNDEEKSVLAAVVRSATGIMPVPGDKVRAGGVPGGAMEPGRVELVLGMLPPAKPTTDPRIDDGRQWSTRTIRMSISRQGEG